MIDIEAAREAIKALTEESFVVRERGYGAEERERYHARHWQALLHAVGLHEEFCSQCGQWHEEHHDC